jgi:hypothetical protein
MVLSQRLNNFFLRILCSEKEYIRIQDGGDIQEGTLKER